MLDIPTFSSQPHRTKNTIYWFSNDDGNVDKTRQKMHVNLWNKADVRTRLNLCFYVLISAWRRKDFELSSSCLLRLGPGLPLLSDPQAFAVNGRESLGTRAKMAVEINRQTLEFLSPGASQK